MTSASGLQAVDLGREVGAWFTGSALEGVVDANLAHHRPHVPDHLAQAREAVARLTGTEAADWHLMRQVHGASVAVVDDRTPVGAELRDVDVMVTRHAARPLVVLAADCIPMLAAGSDAIGVAHAGWRGLQADVPGALVTALQELGERPEDIRVAFGPSIGPCCYEVGPEVVEVVAAIDDGAVSTTRSGTPSVDLRAAARNRLLRLGVGKVIDAAPGCTACDAAWFSHRRDPTAGRHAGLIVRREVTG
jgi:YfiH family protein